MEIQLNDYHKKVNAQMKKSMAYWREHPLSLEECLAQFKRLREQRLARESKLQGKESYESRIILNIFFHKGTPVIYN